MKVGSFAVSGFALVALALVSGCGDSVNSGFTVPVDADGGETYEAGPGLEGNGGPGHCAAPPAAPRAFVGNLFCDASKGSARAEVIDAKVPLLGATASVEDTGEVHDAQGQSLTALQATVSGVATTGTISATAWSSTEGGAYAKSSIEGLNLTLLGIGIKADAIVAEATVSCGERSGAVTVVNLTALGQPVNVKAGGSVTVGGLLKIALDERTEDPDGMGLTVRALHITAVSGSAVDVTVAYAAADTEPSCGCKSAPRDGGASDAGPTACNDNSDCPGKEVCVPDSYDSR